MVGNWAVAPQWGLYEILFISQYGHAFTYVRHVHAVSQNLSMDR